MTIPSLFVLVVPLVEVGPCPRVLTKTEFDSKGKTVFLEDEAGFGVKGITCRGFVAEVLVLLDFVAVTANEGVLEEARELFSKAAAEALAAASEEGAAEPVMVIIPGLTVSVADTEDEETESAFGGTTIVSVGCDELVLTEVVLEVMPEVD